MTDLEQLKYPAGKFHKPDFISPHHIRAWIQDIRDFPDLLAKELEGLSPADLLKTYRPGGWNISQVVHHVADSHMNSFIRFKLSLTEGHPAIKPYLEGLWAELPDGKDLPPGISLNLLSSLHLRWCHLLDRMTDTDFQKGYFHPEKNRVVPLDEATCLYAWHCRHHLGHIRLAKQNTQ